MNYFEFHIGDYAEATGHLSIIEDGAYSRLLRKCYSTERALPPDICAVQRLVAARSEEERSAVESVLREFFELRDDGWHQPRCDRDIANYLAGEPERVVKRANENGRLKRHRAERAGLFEVLHADGQHPSWNTPMAELRALVRNVRTAIETPPETKPETPPATEAATTPATETAMPATATQYPLPIPHSPTPTPHPPFPTVIGKKHRQSQFPDDFKPNEAGEAAGAGLSMETELEAFKNHHTGKGSLMADWQAAWRTWCGNARKYAKPTAFASNTKPASKHAGFEKLDYRKGVNHDGSFE